MVLPRVIGHRGAAAYAPENTLAGFQQSLSLNCSMVEFDVMLSKDGEAFVFHDEIFKRTSNGKGKFGEATSDYIRSLDAGRWFSKRFKGEKIPTLKEVLQWLATVNLQANIEIKPTTGTSEQTTIAVLSHINHFWPLEKSLPLVSSFDHEALYLCRSISPEMPIGLLLDTWEEQWLKKAKELQCFSIHLNHRILSKARVLEITEQGYKVCAYTVNRRFRAKKLFAWGVDAIFSDYPDLLN